MRLGLAIVGVTALVLSGCARSTREDSPMGNAVTVANLHLALPIAATKAGAGTVVVSTGGHYALIERFAITALRAD